MHFQTSRLCRIFKCLKKRTANFVDLKQFYAMKHKKAINDTEREKYACLVEPFDTAFEVLLDEKDAKDITEFERTKNIATKDPANLKIELAPHVDDIEWDTLTHTSWLRVLSLLCISYFCHLNLYDSSSDNC